MKKILAFLLFPSMCLAADLPKEAVTESIIDEVYGGLATSIPSHKLSKEFSPNLRNIHIDNGSIEQIKGFIEIGSTNTLNGGFQIDPYFLEDGSGLYLVNDSSVVLETSDFKSFVFVSSGHNVGVKMRCKQIENKMWCSNGVDAVFTWNHIIKTILDGTKGNPNVPKGKYIGYNQDKVWMYNIPSNASAAYYSDSRSTNGVIISPDNFLAWPADNFIQIGKGDGQIGTAIWNDNGRMKFGKERSIYTLFGDNPYVAVLSNPSVGVASHDSVVMMDNQSNFLGNDGIYRDEVGRSNLIQDESDSISRTSIKTVSNFWESQADFSKGQFFGTTATVAGILQPRVSQINVSLSTSAIAGTFPDFVRTGESSPGNAVLTTGNTFYGHLRVDFRGNLDNSERFYTRCINLANINRGVSGGVDPRVGVYVYNLFTGAVISTVVHVPNQVGTIPTFCFNPVASVPETNVLFEGAEVNQSSYAIKFEHTNIADAGSDIVVGFGSSWEFRLGRATTGQFVSEVTTNTSITTWGLFDSIRNTNGGNIKYYIRSSTSIVNMSTQTWKPIVPGVNVGEPIQNRFVQWATTITSVSSFTNVSNVDNVEIVHIEGEGALNRAFAISWQGRYWLWTSTSSDAISSYGILRGNITNKNPDAYMPVSGINIRSLAKNGESVLYGGSSSSGTFYRLDFGDNFNGAAIDSFYETPSIYFNKLTNEKKLLEYHLTADRNMGSSFNLGISTDGGDFAESTINLSGSGILNKVLVNVSGQAKLFSWRFHHNTYDDPFKIHNFFVTYLPTSIRKGIND